MAKKKILLIDDDRALCEELTELLATEGYDVKSTADSAKGMELLRGADFDLAILDEKMPGKTGIELIRGARQRISGKKVLMLTGKPSIDEILRREGLSDLVSGTFSKPLNIDGFLSKVSELTA